MREKSLPCRFLTFTPMGLILMLLSGVTPSPTDAQDKQFRQTDKLIKRVENTVKSINETRKQVKKTHDAYKKMMRKKGKDQRSEYKKLVKELDRSEKKTDDIGKRIADMTKVANSFFEEWSEGIEDIRSDDLRRRGQQRLDDARGRQDEISEAGQQAKAEYELFIANLRDQVAYLEYDLNSDAADSLEADADNVTRQVASLYEKIDEITKLTNEYIRALKS